MPEILAPAGSPEALTAAVRCGADAVYLGMKQLNARRNAGNFEFDELVRGVKYAHARNVKIYLTLNTLATDAELHSLAVSAVQQACDAGVDALIVQDLGVAALARETAHDMPLHASTQMSVHTLSGVELLRENGFKRCVLAREMSGEEIGAIAARTDAELEVFVHGALCMCVSGQCYLSAMLGSRSANRGQCAQPCRLPFAAENGTGNDLSLRDLSLIDFLPELAEIGVTSFKIEGRMKRPEYVAAAVTACRRKLENKPDAEIGGALRAVFSRSGFTDGYFKGEIGRSMFGIRRKEDVERAAPVLKNLASLYAKEPARVPVDMCFTALKGETASLAVSSGGKSVFVRGDTVPEQAVNKLATRESVATQLEKCGGTQFFVRSLDCELDEGLSLPASQLNQLRRQALESLNEALSAHKLCEFSPKAVEYSVHNAKKQELYARFTSEKQLPDDLYCYNKIILPLEMKSYDFGVPAAAELPRFMFGREDIVLEQLLRARENGASEAFVSTIDGLALAKKAGMRVMAGIGTNLFNTAALGEIERLGADSAVLSFELDVKNASRLGGKIPRGAVAYGRLPLMTTRCCPVKNGKSCAECGSSGGLTDRMGVFFPVRCFGGCPQLLNSRPLWMGDRKKELGFADFLLLYFTVENAHECKKVTADFLASAPPSGEFTRGLYYRGV